MKILQTFIIVAMKIVQDQPLKMHWIYFSSVHHVVQVLNLKKNEKIRKNFSKKIDNIKGDLRV